MSNELPKSTISIESGTAGGLASGTDNILVLGCSSSGPLNTPRFLSSGKAMLDTFAYGDASEFVCHYVKKVRKKVCFIRVPSTTAGAVDRTNDDGVAGTSVITLTGTPHRRMHLLFEVIDGGTIGATGITFKHSLNGGLDYSGTIRLGTANTYAIPKSGITLNFAAGTLVAADVFEAHTSSPKWSTAEFADAVTAAIALQQKFRALVVVGDFNKTEALALQTQVDNLYAARKRPVVFVAARDWYPDCELTGNPNLTFADASPDTITRAAGSFITDGFKAGMTITVAGSTSNNGTYTVATVGALVLTLDPGDALAAEGPSNGRTITGEETEETWAQALIDNYAGFEDTTGRMVVGAGYDRMTSEIFQQRMRVPSMWGAVERWMQHDLQVSPNRKKDGKLDDHVLTDDDNNVVEHDARTLDSLLEERFLVARTYDEDDGAYVAYPATMGPDGSAFGVIPWVAVANLMGDVVQRATEMFIGDNPELNDDGTLTDEERDRYEDFVNEQLEAELLSPGAEGPRASSVSWAASPDDVLNVPNAILNGEGTLVTLGLVNKIATRILVNPSST